MSKEKSFSGLIEVVEQEAEILEALSDMLYRQKSAAIKGDTETLNILTESQGRAYKKLSDLEKQRLELITPFAEELNMSPEEVTLKTLKERYQGRLDAKEDWLLSAVKPLANRVKRALKLNSLILKKCLQLGENRLRAMMDFQQRQEVYNLNGKKTPAGKNSGAILNRQI
jgi:flagellar biosynthesis/type III secretory pathway chaperone